MHSAISITEQNDTNKVQKTNAQTTTECQVKKIIKNNKKNSNNQNGLRRTAIGGMIIEF